MAEFIRLRMRSPVLLGFLWSFLVLGPLLGSSPAGRLGMSILLAAVFVAALLELSDRKRPFLIGLGLAVPAVLGTVRRTYCLRIGSELLFDCFSLAFLIYVTWYVFAHTVRRGPVNAERLSGAAAGYMLAGFTWMVVYEVVDDLWPGSFAHAGGEAMTRYDYLYFSYVTLTTLGYGDISPQTGFARALSVAEAIMGVFYLAVIVARIVAAYRLPEDEPGSQ